MKPIIDGKGIIAKLGNRELTREKLRRMPKGVKDKVVFYPGGRTPDEELDEELKAAIAWGFINAELNGSKISLDKYLQSPTNIKNKVVFNITDKGKKVLSMKDDKKEIFLHFDRWITKREVAEMMRLPLKKVDDYVSDLMEDGLVEEQNGKFKSKESMKFLRVQDYLNHFDKSKAPAIIKSEWATKEELSIALNTPADLINNTLTHHINMGLIEEKDGLYRINDSDGKAMDRIKEYMNKIKTLRKEEKFGIGGAIEVMVKGGIYDAIKKGWIEFQDGRSYTADEWKSLDNVEQDNVGVRLTEKGKREIEDDNPLKIYDELAEKKRADGGLNLVADVHEKDGEIHLILTEEGERVKKLGEAMGISPERVFETMLNVGLRKQLSGYMIIGSDAFIDGTVNYPPRNKVGLSLNSGEKSQ